MAPRRQRGGGPPRDSRYLEFVKTLQLGFLLRNSFALFALAACLLLRDAHFLRFHPLPLILILLAEVTLNQPWPWLLQRIRTVEGLKRLSFAHLLGDIVVVSLCIVVTGGLRVAFLNVAYIFLILWAGFFLSARVCYATALVSAAAYGIVLRFESMHGFQPFALLSEWPPLPLERMYLAIGVGHAACLLLVAYFGARASRLLAANQQAQQTSRALKADLDQTFRRLLHSEKLAATGELAAGMAHEIYNPLTAIAGLAETALLASDPLPPRIRETLTVIKTQAERAGAVVRRLLGFARPADPQWAPCHLNQVVTDSLAMVRYKADLHQITIDLALDPDLPPLIGDHIQLQEVCVNLLLNAVQAMPTGGRLRVATRQASDGPCPFELEVTDTGCGIPASHLPRIFDPFFTTKPSGVGTGLGLSVSHSVIQRHGGSIEVQSQPGWGTTFRVLLPKDPRTAPRPSEGPPAMVVDLARSMATPTILVVDDDQAVCQM
ncbi:MAG: hypothetical protein HY600_04225, partial [Candidatus Omnitrophica bacterium]|nr:hypothetical protein [Candidatus Omnitrophota bacterium]